MGKVAGPVAVSLTDDSHSIVLKQFDWKVSGDGAAYTVLSPRHARHLASLLIMEAEAWAILTAIVRYVPIAEMPGPGLAGPKKV